jgi:transglutaminase-like putative cysteine protease
MAYSVRHITRFKYAPAVRESVMEVRMQPRTDAQQRCLSFSLDVSPRASMMMYRDFFGNAVHHFDIPGQHELIEVAAQAVVEVLPPLVAHADAAGDWEELDARVALGDYWEMMLPSQYAKPTELLEKLRAHLDLRRRGNPLELLMDLNMEMYEFFEYAPNTTKVDSPIDEALESRQGVCQDFAHIMIALVRQLKIPCRYVSGYLFHADSARDRSPAGATHAWVEAYLGELGWVAFDPTNNLLGCERHIRVAIGRDYSDVPPTRGVHKGEAGSELSVTVSVSPVDAPEPADLPAARVTRFKSPNANSSSDLDQLHQQQQ